MAANILCTGFILCVLFNINGAVVNKPKPVSANAGRKTFVFSAKNQFSFGGNTGSGNAAKIGTQQSSQGGNEQQQPAWKQQLPVNVEPNKNQQETNPQLQNNQQNQQMQQQQFQNGQMVPNGFQRQQFGSSMTMNGQQFQQQPFNQPTGMQQQHHSQQQQLSNMDPQMFKQNTQHQKAFGQPNNIPNGHSQPFDQQQQQQGSNQFNQFGGQPMGNGLNVLAQNRPSNMPPYQTMNMMPQQGFQPQTSQTHMTQFNQAMQQPNGQFFNPSQGQLSGPIPNQMHGQLSGPPPNQMQGHQNMQMPGQTNNNPAVGPNAGPPNMPGQVPINPTGQFMPSPAGQQQHFVAGQGGFIGQNQGQHFQQNPNLAVIDHPMKVSPTPTTTPKPPTSTVDGEGFVCMTTADCEVGCCFNSSGQLLDTTTYGPGGPKEGRASGKCFIRSPGLGGVCDDLCPCQMGHDCYRRYVPNYPKPGEKPPPPVDPEAAPKPQRKCVRSAVVEAERSAFWRCYFDVACSGPLP